MLYVCAKVRGNGYRQGYRIWHATPKGFGKSQVTVVDNVVKVDIDLLTLNLVWEP